MDEECLICGEKLEIVVIDDQVGKGIHDWNARLKQIMRMV
jgi:hypothetical protein